MDGITFIRSVRKLPDFKFTPILMLTTESQGEKKQEGRAAGATGWIVKPFDPQKLLDTISRRFFVRVEQNLMTIDLSGFRDIYLQECAEHLACMESDLLRIESSPAEPELLNSIFRAAHSIKGGFRTTFGFNESPARFTHTLESLPTGCGRGSGALAGTHAPPAEFRGYGEGTVCLH